MIFVLSRSSWHLGNLKCFLSYGLMFIAVEIWEIMPNSIFENLGRERALRDVQV